MPVGRPISLTPNIATNTISIAATEGQTTFTPSGGYRINELAVYRNGVRLVQGRDYTAVDGSNVVLQSGATAGDILDFQIFDSFNVADAISSNGNQVMGGDLTVGLTTLYSGTTGIVSTGELRATTLYGDGSNLSNVISGVEVQLSGSTVGTSATVLNFSSGFSTATPVSAGISTIETTRTLTIGVRSGTAVTFSISGESFNVSGRGGNVAIDV